MVPQEDRQKRPQRQHKLREIVKWNNEDGTALSEMQRKRGLEVELTGICGYACLKTLITASGSMPCIANAQQSALYHQATSLLAQVESQSEDNDNPFHAALFGWHASSVNDVGYQDGLKAFATLWKELQTSPSSVPEVILRACKAYLCAATEHIHAILLPEGLINPIGPDGAFTVNEKDQHQEEEEDAKLEPDPIDIEAAEIAEILPLKIDGSKKDNKRRKLHSDGSIVAKSTFRGTNQTATEDIGLAVTYSHRRAVVYYFYHSLKWEDVPGYLKPKHKEGDKYFKCNHCPRVVRPSAASNGNTRTLHNHLENHGRSITSFFSFLKEKQDKEMAITEEEMQKAAGIIPVRPFALQSHSFRVLMYIGNSI
ncbi:hypothetical protein BT69DRAFT_1335138 [Atractiella rhizophila]|nr:hypothetical protein BT69DRAFT_1335138 [Atractiella rhizophila]